MNKCRLTIWWYVKVTLQRRLRTWSPDGGWSLSCCYFVHARGANAQSVKTNLQKWQFLPKVPFELAKSTSLIHYTPHTSKYALYDSGRLQFDGLIPERVQKSKNNISFQPTKITSVYTQVNDEWHIYNCTNHKKVILPTSTYVNVLLSNITFLCINCSFLHLYLQLYCVSVAVALDCHL